MLYDHRNIALDRLINNGSEGELAALEHELKSLLRQVYQRRQLPALEFSGTVGASYGSELYLSPIATAEDYARFVAAAANFVGADDTSFVAEGATVTAYVHSESHMSATFTLDENRPYPLDT
jgi:hypothetical protein